MLPPEGALGGVAGVSSGVDDDEGASDACPPPEEFERSALLESFEVEEPQDPSDEELVPLPSVGPPSELPPLQPATPTSSEITRTAYERVCMRGDTPRAPRSPLGFCVSRFCRKSRQKAHPIEVLADPDTDCDQRARMPWQGPLCADGLYA